MLAVLNPAMARLATLPAPVISVVHGSVGGAGIALACCADFVLASHTARLRAGYSAIGLTPDIGASWQVTRRIGATRAKQLFLLNQTLDAEQCLAMGLFDQLHEPQALAEVALQLAQTLAAGATQAFARIKRLCDQADRHDVASFMELESAALLASTQSADAREGVQAFIEKRPASFTGH
jgi:2-(1,2-epoxy-1,2-dihydrophenyl)acetyl-CoA isomerase